MRAAGQVCERSIRWFTAVNHRMVKTASARRGGKGRPDSPAPIRFTAVNHRWLYTICYRTDLRWTTRPVPSGNGVRTQAGLGDVGGLARGVWFTAVNHAVNRREYPKGRRDVDLS